MGGFGPFETLEDPFPRGPPEPSPPTSGIISLALVVAWQKSSLTSFPERHLSVDNDHSGM